MIRYFAIPPAAADLCGVGYALTTAAEPQELRIAAVMPQLQLTVTGGLAQRVGGGVRRNATLSLVGATHAASQLTLEPRTSLYGIGLTPLGWAGAARVGADEVADSLVEGGAIWGDRDQRHLVDCAQSAQSDEAVIGLLYGFVVARAQQFADADTRREAAIEAWLARAGQTDLDALTRSLDLSYRQAARLTCRSHGASPKQLLMKYRVLRMAAATALSPGLVGVDDPRLLADDFYDQAHFIRNFRRFTGYTPDQFRREQAAFARDMLRLRWQAGARSPITLWS